MTTATLFNNENIEREFKAPDITVDPGEHGARLIFDNGWHISILFRRLYHGDAREASEVALFDPSGEMMTWPEGDLVAYDVSMERLHHIVAKVREGSITYTHQEPAPPPETRVDDGWGG